MIGFQYRISSEGQQCPISDFSLASPRTLSRGVQDGAFYRLLDPVALIHTSENPGPPSNFEEAYTKHV
jgi:hypothetical protein